MDVISALEQSYDQTAKLVAGLTPAELDAPSPCAGWDVRATLNHMLGATWMFTLVNQGQAADEDAGDVIGDDASLAVTLPRRRTSPAGANPDAFEGDRCYAFGTFPATGAAMLNLGRGSRAQLGRRQGDRPGVGDRSRRGADDLRLGHCRSRSTTSVTMAPSAPKWRCRRRRPLSTASSACSAVNP